MVTLIYHKKLDASWTEAAAELRSILTKVPSCTSHDVQLLGRSRKQKVKLGNDHVDEVMTVFGKDYSYRQVEGAFSQPNGGQSVSHITSHCYFSLTSTCLLMATPEFLPKMGLQSFCLHLRVLSCSLVSCQCALQQCGHQHHFPQRSAVALNPNMRNCVTEIHVVPVSNPVCQRHDSRTKWHTASIHVRSASSCF